MTWGEGKGGEEKGSEGVVTVFREEWNLEM